MRPQDDPAYQIRELRAELRERHEAGREPAPMTSFQAVFALMWLVPALVFLAGFLTAAAVGGEGATVRWNRYFVDGLFATIGIAFVGAAPGLLSLLRGWRRYYTWILMVYLLYLPISVLGRYWLSEQAVNMIGNVIVWSHLPVLVVCLARGDSRRTTETAGNAPTT